MIARLPSELGLLAAEVAHELERPVAVELAGCPFDGMWNYGSLPGKVYAPIYAERVRRAVRRADHVLYVTRDFLQARYPARGVTVACSNVEIPDPSPAVRELRLDRIRGDRAGAFVLGTIATLNGRFKGLQTVIGALPAIRAARPDVEFRVLGPGDAAPWRAEAARHGVADLVRFEGVLQGRGRVFEWLDRVDLYLQPSLKEGLPRALVEAMSRACPALGARTGGIPELLGPDHLLEPRDSRALARAVLGMAG